MILRVLIGFRDLPARIGGTLHRSSAGTLVRNADAKGDGLTVERLHYAPLRPSLRVWLPVPQDPGPGPCSR